MSDPREQAPDPAPLGSPASPPPGPWWSRPAEPWGTPAGQPSAGPPGAGQAGAGQPSAGPAGAGQPAAGQEPTVVQPPYGSYRQQGAPQPAPEDPWRQPGSTAVFGTGAPTWGHPTDTIGVPPQPPSRGRRGLGTAALVLATALIAGSAGGYFGARSGNGSGLLDPTASLGAPGGTSSAVVDRAPDSVAGIAARVIKSTVSIAVQAGTGSGTGSGVIIRSDGYVLTNNHVVAAAANGGTITVTFDGSQGQPVPARVVGRDVVTDLAVLRVTVDTPLQAASLGQSRNLVVGDPVIAIGSPLGLSGTVTSGIISALNRTVDVPSDTGGRNPLFNAIQTDAAINPGNSGGALVNAKGEVIGINSAIATLGGSGGFGGQSQGGSIGVGFAIPIDEARSVAEEIIRTGKATHPAIGVSALTVGGADRPGARVRDLTAGGAAAKAGLQVGDLIVKVGGTDVKSVDELILAIRQHKVGDTVTVTYVRNGGTATADLTLQDLPTG